MVPEDTYKETRILAIRRGMDIGSLVDEALREKIIRDYQRMGLQPPFQQTHPQPPSQQDEPVVHSARYEAAKSKSNGPIAAQQSLDGDTITPVLGRGEGEITIDLPGLKFPTSKVKLLEYTKIRKNRSTLFFIKDIPEGKTYENVFQLQEDFKSIINNLPIIKEKYEKKGWRGFVECIIDTSETQKNSTFKGDTAVPGLPRKFQQIPLFIEGLEFPANKYKILKTAERSSKTKPDVLSLIKNLPNKNYETVVELEMEMSKIFNDKESEELGLVESVKSEKPGKNIICRIVTDSRELLAAPDKKLVQEFG
jgi:hypothetical protein